MPKQLSDLTLEQLWELFPIILKPHNPDYVQWYSEEKNSLLTLIHPNEFKRLSHIGSSAVPGLISKPTVDILLEVATETNVEILKKKLTDANWTLMSSQSEPYMQLSFNKGYTIHGFAPKVFHLHVRYIGDWNELYFKDYLISHPEVAKQYAELKLQLQKRYEHNRDGYTQAKTDFIQYHTTLARQQFKDRYK